MKNLEKFNTSVDEIKGMLKKENITLDSDEQIIFDESLIFTHREWKLYNPNRSLDNALDNKEVFCFVPCFDL